jgi:hypothetical protein
MIKGAESVSAMKPNVAPLTSLLMLPVAAASDFVIGFWPPQAAKKAVPAAVPAAVIRNLRRENWAITMQGKVGSILPVNGELMIKAKYCYDHELEERSKHRQQRAGGRPVCHDQSSERSALIK